MNWFGRILMSPFALVYGFLISLRNALYDSGFLRSTSFDLPVISVGNLKVGGTGKTPTVEWLIIMLAPYVDVAVLSRGFSRKSKGYRLVNASDIALEVGDEALQIKRKFPSISVAVSESRTLGISSLLMKRPSIQVVLLDDAFQHRSIDPSLSIVLTEYYNPYYHDYIIPMGKLREWRSAIDRADYLIVSKCPKNLTREQAESFKTKVKGVPSEKIYFAHIDYGPCYSIEGMHRQLQTHDQMAVQVISGIAEPEYLKDHFRVRVDRVYSYDFPDHHPYQESDVKNIISSFSRIPYQEKALVTTEKDIVKLIQYIDIFKAANIELYVQRIGVKILFDQQQKIEEELKKFLLDFAS